MRHIVRHTSPSPCHWKVGVLWSVWAFSSYICPVKDRTTPFNTLLLNLKLSSLSLSSKASSSLIPILIALTVSSGHTEFHPFISTFLPILLTLPHHHLKASLSRSTGSPALIALKPLWQTSVRKEQCHKTLSSVRPSHQRDFCPPRAAFSARLTAQWGCAADYITATIRSKNNPQKLSSFQLWSFQW